MQRPHTLLWRWRETHNYASWNTKKPRTYQEIDKYQKLTLKGHFLPYVF
jgi:hypothetical protein